MNKSMIGETLTCAETGKQFIGLADGITVNYARNDEGQIFSDEGVDIRQRRELLDRTKPFYAYVSGDSKSITGWKGNILMNVYQSWSIRTSRISNSHTDKTYRFFRARDVHGCLWYGRGSAGVCITMLPIKRGLK